MKFRAIASRSTRAALFIDDVYGYDKPLDKALKIRIALPSSMRRLRYVKVDEGFAGTTKVASRTGCRISGEPRFVGRTP